MIMSITRNKFVPDKEAGTLLNKDTRVMRKDFISMSNTNSWLNKEPRAMSKDSRAMCIILSPRPCCKIPCLIQSRDYMSNSKTLDQTTNTNPCYTSNTDPHTIN